MRRNLSRARGFTLLELMVYLGLVGTALATLGTLELGARQAAALQGAMLDVDREAARFLGTLRADVEAARTLRVLDRGATLELARLDGTSVRYAGLERAVGRGDKVLERRRYPRLRAVSFEELKGGGVQATASFAALISGQEELKRTYRRAATPRREAAP